MSRQYDEELDAFPMDIPNADYAENYNVCYRRIADFPDYYATTDGEIISCVGGRPHSMSTWTNQYGHRYTRLRTTTGKPKTVLVHREVANAFIPNPKNLPVVRHMDDDPSNNSLNNLAWGTQLDNRNDMIDHGRAYSKSVICLNDGHVYESCAEAAEALGVHRSVISMVCRGRRAHAKGKKLRYLKEGDGV